jgi:hypothetical protein
MRTVFVGNFNGTDNLESLKVDGRILKWILKGYCKHLSRVRNHVGTLVNRVANLRVPLGGGGGA